jgi:hypothetical protein
MENKTGIPVRGPDFFKRDNLITQAWDLIEKGSNILIAAPRRVGKTSLMFYLVDHPQKKYKCLYITTESVNNENEFYRKLVNKLVKTDYVKKLKKIQTYFIIHFPEIKKIGPEGIEFGSKETHNYIELASQILKSINSGGFKLVLLFDEFPETLDNIIRDEGENAGIHFLQSNRELRQDPEIITNVRFIYTGSIGIENIVGMLNASSTIMDLSRLKITPLGYEEAKEFFMLLLENAAFKMPLILADRALEEIKWLIPFYIQLIVEELSNICRDKNISSVSREILDGAFTSLLERRNAFEHWHTRLRASLRTAEYNFSKELLNTASENDKIHSNEIVDIAVKYKLESKYKDLVNSLIYDGYINNQEEENIYRFNSPLLRMWWRENAAC